MTGAAAARLFDDHVVAVHALVARRVGPTAAPAVTSETFELAVRTWDQFDSERGTERLFLYGAATTTLRRHAATEAEHLRSLRVPPGRPVTQIEDPLFSATVEARPRARVVDHESNRDLHGSGPGDDLAPTSGTGDDSGSLDARVMRSVADLHPDDRDIVLLSIWESCSQSAIAEALAMSVGDVRSSLGRIRRELKASADR